MKYFYFDYTTIVLTEDFFEVADFLKTHCIFSFAYY